jgi:phosphohistidine phosphatase
MKVLLIRHAIAEDRDAASGIADDDRALTAEGIQKFKKSMRGIAELVNEPDLILTSPLARARQTCEIVNDAWSSENLFNLSMVTENLRPEAAPDLIHSEIFERLGDQSDALVAVVGHEPHLSILASWWISGRVAVGLKLKKGGAALIEFDREFAKGSGCLAWLAPPSVLRRL